MFDKVQKPSDSSSDWSPARLQKQDNFSPQPQQEKLSSLSMPTKGEDTWSLDKDPLLSRWKKEEAAGETQPIAMANAVAQKEDTKSSLETKAGLEQSLIEQQTDEVETNRDLQKSQQKEVKSQKKSSLSSQEQSELANVIQQLLGFWEPVGMFVAGIIYQWLYHNGQPARWLLQVFVPGWDRLEKDVAQGLPKHWAFQAGQSLGDGLALATGIIEIITGGGAAAAGASLCTTGLVCLAGAPAMVGGLALGLHGSATSSSALTSIAARLGIVFHSSSDSRDNGTAEPTRISEAERIRRAESAKRFENFRRKVDPKEIKGARPVEGSSTAGHARSKHGVSDQAQANILNNSERIFSGKNTNGREVDIYYKERSVVITEAGDKTKVITSYGPVSAKGKATPVNPEKWANDVNYVEIKIQGYDEIIYPSVERFNLKNWP